MKLKKELSKGIVVPFKQCSKLIKNCQRHFLDFTNKFVETNSDEDKEDEIKASESASQISVNTFIVSTKSDLAQQIEFEYKHTEIESTEEIAKARKTRLLAEAEAHEPEIKLRHLKLRWKLTRFAS